MTAAARVSVVMPVYNGERYIADAVESALASTFHDFELLVVDDGSTDRSVEIVGEIAAGDKRVRVVRVPHGGVAAARNAALREARAALVANLDSDDLMPPDRLALQVAYLDANPDCVAVGGRSLIIDGDGAPLRVVGRYFHHAEIDAALLDGNGGALGNDTAMFRRDAALGIGGYSSQLRSTGEDHDLWLRLAEVGRLACLPAVLNHYRIHGTNVSVGDGSRERRLPVTLDNLARAFQRRGIADRAPMKRAAPPLRRAERWCDEGMLRWYRGERFGALARLAGAVALEPRLPTARYALGALMRDAAPRMPQTRQR